MINRSLFGQYLTILFVALVLVVTVSCKTEEQKKKRSAGSATAIPDPVDDCEGFGLQDDEDSESPAGSGSEGDEASESNNGDEPTDDLESEDSDSNLPSADEPADPSAQSGPGRPDCDDPADPGDVGPVTGQSVDDGEDSGSGGNSPSVTSGGSRKSLEDCAEDGKAWIAVVDGGQSPPGCGESLASFCCQEEVVYGLFPTYADRLKDRFTDATGDGLKLYHCSQSGKQITFHLAKFADGRTSYRNVFIEASLPDDVEEAGDQCPMLTSEDLGFPAPGDDEPEEEDADDDDDSDDDSETDSDDEPQTTAPGGDDDATTDGGTDGDGDGGAAIIDDEVR